MSVLKKPKLGSNLPLMASGVVKILFVALNRDHLSIQSPKSRQNSKNDEKFPELVVSNFLSFHAMPLKRFVILSKSQEFSALTIFFQNFFIFEILGLKSSNFSSRFQLNKIITAVFFDGF